MLPNHHAHLLFLGRGMRGHPRGRRDPSLEGSADATLLSTKHTGMVEPTSVGETIQPVLISKDNAQRGCRAGCRVQQKKTQGNRLSGIYNLTQLKLTQKETNILNAGLKCTSKKISLVYI